MEAIQTFAPRERLRRKIDYRALGIEGLCMRCGRNNHKTSKCWANDLHCQACNKRCHVERVCLTTLLQTQRSSSTNSSSENTVQTTVPNMFKSHFNAYKIQTIFNLYDNEVKDADNNVDDDKYYATVKINNCPVEMEVDSGAKFSLLPINHFRRLNIQTQILPVSVGFRSYSGQITYAEGKVHVNVEYKRLKIRGTLYLVPPGHDALLGRTWIRGLQIVLSELDQQRSSATAIYSATTTVNFTQVSKNDNNELLKEYADLFQEKIGCIPNVEIDYKLCENTTRTLFQSRTQRSSYITSKS